MLQAKKKAQQDKAAEKAGAKRSQAATSAAAQPLTAKQNSMADSSDSEQEEQESFSLQDSRFASLVDDKQTPAAVGGLQGAPSLGQGSQLAAPLSSHETAAGSSAADSDHEEEGAFSSSVLRL